MASVYMSKPFNELTAGDLDRSLAVDLRAGYACALAAVPHMRRAGGGRIINIADWLAASHRPRYKGYLTYYVAKSAVIGLTEALALELAGDAILVNAVAPGPILAAGGHHAGGIGVDREGHAAGAVGRERSRSQRPSSPSSRATSSPGRRSAWTAGANPGRGRGSGGVGSERSLPTPPLPTVLRYSEAPWRL